MALGVACDDSPDDVPDGIPPLDAAPDAALPDVALPSGEPCEATLSLAYAARHPGGGHRVVVRGEGAPIDPECLSVEADGAALPSAARAFELPPGELVLLVDAATATDPTALEALLASRPATERVAALRVGRELQLLSAFTRNRALLAERVLRVPADPADTGFGMDAARTAALELLRSIGGEADRGLQTVMALGETPGAAAHAIVGTCVDTAGQTVRVGGQLDVELRKARKEARAVPCDAARIATGVRSWPRRVELLFTAEQRAAYEAIIADHGRADFELSLRLAPDEAPIAAVAHLRGQTSISCARRNYTVNLDGGAARRLVPGMAGDEFLLLSMCRDEAYVNQYTADLLLAELDLFPVPFGLTELWLDGESRGVYLVIEKPQDALRRTQTGVRSVIRRRFDPEDKPADIKWARDGDAAARAEYDALASGAEGLAGEALEAYLDARLDLDQLLRFMAFHTLLRTGDYVDEAYFVATDTVRDGAVQAHFAVSGWDPDDLFSDCHHDGRFAFEDPHGLLYCAEGDLELLVAGDATLYARYVEVLAALREELTVARFDATLERTRRDLLPFLDDPAVAAAMTELVDADPSTVEPARARAVVSEALDTMGTLYRERRAAVGDAITAWRQR